MAAAMEGAVERPTSILNLFAGVPACRSSKGISAGNGDLLATLSEFGRSRQSLSRSGRTEQSNRLSAAGGTRGIRARRYLCACLIGS